MKFKNKKQNNSLEGGFFFVDKRFEISNLLKDLIEIIRLADFLKIDC
jgi:hypothetical protein